MGSDTSVHETCKLSGDANYGSWNFILENILRREDMWRFSESRMSPDATEDERKLRQRALSIINLSIHHSLHQYVRMFRDPYDVWHALKIRYASSSSSRKIMLLQKLLSLKMSEAQRMDEFFLETRNLVDQLGEIALALPEELISIIVLNALPKLYKGFVQSLISRDELPPWGNIEAKLISEEVRLKSEEPDVVDEAMAAQTYTRPPYRMGPRFQSNFRGRNFRGSERNHRDFDYRIREPNRHRNGKCDSCGQVGHWERECPLKAIDEQIHKLELRKRELRRSEAHTVHRHESEFGEDYNEHSHPDEEYEDTTLSTHKATTTEALLTEMLSQNQDTEAFAVEDHSTAWYLDSGASNHVTGNRKLLVDVKPAEQHRVVHTAGGQSLPVKGVGSVVIQLPNGEIKTIGNILYVPGLTKKLFSVGSITDRGLTVHFLPHACHVVDKNTRQVLIKGIRDSVNSLYRVESSFFISCTEVHTISHTDTAALWHARLGHPNERRLRTLFHNQLAFGLPKHIPTESSICETCIAGKQTRLPFPKHTQHRASKPLQLLHADLWGPAPVSSYSGARYFLSIIDDYSRKNWVYFLTQKGAAFDTFCTFQGMVEKETGLHIVSIRTDRGGEFTSNAFIKHCQTHGIQRQLTMAGTPQQNGVVERRNRTLLETARCLTANQDLPQQLWAEAISTAAYLHNRLPSKTTPHSTPEELYFGSKPDISHLKIFGSTAFVHVPSTKRDKLSPKTIKCIFVGYDTSSKTYRCFNPQTQKILLSRDVEFVETPHSTATPSSAPAPSSPPSLEQLFPPTSPSLPHPSPLDPTPPPPSPSTLPSHHPPAPPSPQPPPTPTSPPAPPPDQLPRRSSRTTTYPRHLTDFVGATECISEAPPEPVSLQDALNHPQWLLAMQDELHSLQSFNTWQLVERPPDTPIISCKWVFAIKTGQAGMPYRYKARLVARGCQQHAGIDYEETYAPVAKWNTLRSTAAIAAHRGWPILHMDVKTAYLNSLLKHRVYMLQPPGFAVKGKENYVLLLLRAIYGLKQSGRSWHQDIDAYLRYLHLIPTSSDSNLYYLHTPHKWILLILYVDDIFITGNDSSHIQTICDQLQSKYQMTLLGAIQKYIGIEFLSTDQGLYLHQAAYIHHLLLESQMAQSNPSHTPLQQNVKLLPDMQSPLTDPTPYRRLVGKLIFLTNTRPDITHVVHQVARFMQTPQIAHLQAIHSILRYLRHTPNHGLFYARGDTGTLSGFTDADWGGASDNRRSVTGYLFKFGQSPITWTSNLKPLSPSLPPKASTVP